MSLCTIANVIARYVFNSPIAWAEEFARYAFVWVVFLGAVACTKQKRHIVIDPVIAALPRRIRAGVLVFADLLIIGLMVTLVRYGWVLTTMSTEPTSMMEIPQYLIYVAVPLSAASGHLLHRGRSSTELRPGREGRGRVMMLWMFVLMLLFFAAGMPVAWSMALAATVYMGLVTPIPLQAIAQRIVGGVDSFPLLAIPFFILAGNLMNTGGITDRLVSFSKVLVGHVRGGLAHVVVVVNMIMAGMSGSGVADAAGSGSVLIPAMHRAGYGIPFAAAIVGAAGTIGPIIPPSIPFVVFGSMANVSIGRLLLAGAVPGVLMGIALMIFAAVIAKRRGYPRDRKATWGELGWATLRALPPWACRSSSWGGLSAAS